MRKVLKTIRFRSDQSGVILPLTAMFLMVLAVMTTALLAVGTSEVRMASNLVRGTQAQYLAEAGLEDAINVFRNNPALIGAAPAALTNVPGLAGPGATLAPFGNYTVQYQSAGLEAAIVKATGTTALGALRRTLHMTVGTPWVQNYAILTGGSIVIPGSPIITGKCGSVHANGSLTMPGGPSVGMDHTGGGELTASGTYSASNNVHAAGVTGGSKPVVTVPTINPASFLAAAQATLPASQIYQFKSNGQVLDGNGALRTTLANSGLYNGWTYHSGSPASWAFTSSTGQADGVQYFEGNVSISGSPGTTLNPWHATIIATGDIQIQGSPNINTLLTDTLFVAGHDMTVTGSPGLGYNGLIAAHEQISISGTPHINGAIIAELATSTDPLVVTDNFSGSPVINASCNIHPPLAGSFTTLTWGR